jgi:hypothetical protein
MLIAAKKDRVGSLMPFDSLEEALQGERPYPMMFLWFKSKGNPRTLVHHSMLRYIIGNRPVANHRKLNAGETP